FPFPIVLIWDIPYMRDGSEGRSRCRGYSHTPFTFLRLPFPVSIRNKRGVTAYTPNSCTDKYGMSGSMGRLLFHGATSKTNRKFNLANPARAANCQLSASAHQPQLSVTVACTAYFADHPQRCQFWHCCAGTGHIALAFSHRTGPGLLPVT